MDCKETEYNNLQPGGKSSLIHTSCRCEDIIRIDSKVKDERCMGGNYLAQGRDQWWCLMNVVMNFWVPLKCRECFE